MHIDSIALMILAMVILIVDVSIHLCSFFLHVTSCSYIVDLPGVEVVGQTSLVVTNSAQTFQWKSYGFNLHVPADSLPADVDSCVLHIYASISGQYQFPDNQELVGAVYWVRCEPSCRFNLPLTAKFQHCAKKGSSPKLNFVRAPSFPKNPPYIFKKEECGTFTDESWHGSVQLDHFSGLAFTFSVNVGTYLSGYFAGALNFGSESQADQPENQADQSENEAACSFRESS